MSRNWRPPAQTCRPVAGDPKPYPVQEENHDQP